MTGITSTMVGAVIMASIAVPTIQLNVMQARGRANMEARLLYQAEVDRAKKIWSENSINFDQHSLYNTTYCKKEDGYGYEDQGFNFKVSCTTGKEKVGGKDLLLSFPANANPSRQASNKDLNIFEQDLMQTTLRPQNQNNILEPKSNINSASTHQNNQTKSTDQRPTIPAGKNPTENPIFSPTSGNQCYSGWKGNSFRNRACELGNQYSMPKY